MGLSAIVLAAGKATRMKSEMVKVLHPICGRPMLSYVLDACRDAGVTRLYVVVGHDRERVMKAMQDATDITWIVQNEQKGTGHAVMVCKEAIVAREGMGSDDHVYVLGGDGPLIRAETLTTLAKMHVEKKAAVTLATSILENPAGYGRIVRDSRGDVTGIVEHGDASAEQRAIKEVNPTYWLFKNADLFTSLDQVKPNNKKGEYYLTDTLAILRGMGRVLAAVPAVPPEDVLSINTRAELADVARVMQRRIQKKVMESGVTIVSPENTWMEYGAEVGADAVIEPFCFLGSGAKVGAGERVRAGTVR